MIWVTYVAVFDIVDDMAFTARDLYWRGDCWKMLQVIHELEPSGVGARDLHRMFDVAIET
jgi:RNA polymerase sigma-54 factor